MIGFILGLLTLILKLHLYFFIAFLVIFYCDIIVAIPMMKCGE